MKPKQKQLQSAIASLILALATSLVKGNVQETLIGITGKDFVILGADSSVASPGSISWTAQLDKVAVMGHVATAFAGDVADSDRLIGLMRAHYNIRRFESSVGSDVEYITLGDNNNEIDTMSMESPMDGLTVEEVAHLARNQIAESLRSRARLNVCLLVAGFSKADPNSDDHVLVGAHFTERLQRQVHQSIKQHSEFFPPSNQSKLRSRLFWVDQYGSLQSLRYGAHGFAANFLLSFLDQKYKEDMTKEEAIDLMKSCFEQLRLRYIIHSPLQPTIKCIDNDGCRVIS